MGHNGAFEVSIFSDVVYSSPNGKPLLADLYLPQNSENPPSVILWLHGGGWRLGDRKVGPDLSRHYAERGFAMASIEYRPSSEAIFPAQVQDVKTAVRWLRSVAGQYGFKPERVGLWGSSSGGHLAALAAISEPGVFEEGEVEHSRYSSVVQAVVVGYGPTDFLQMDAHRDLSWRLPNDLDGPQIPPPRKSADPDSFESLLLGAPIQSCPERVREANPATYARSGVAPFYILHGLCDSAVPVHQSELLYEALGASGNEVTLCLVEGLGHGFLNKSDFGEGPPKPVTIRHRKAGHSEVITHAPPASFQSIEKFFQDHLCSDGG